MCVWLWDFPFWAGGFATVPLFSRLGHRGRDTAGAPLLSQQRRVERHRLQAFPASIKVSNGRMEPKVFSVLGSRLCWMHSYNEILSSPRSSPLLRAFYIPFISDHHTTYRRYVILKPRRQKQARKRTHGWPQSGLRARYEQKSITSSPTASVCVWVCVFMSIITSNAKTRPFKDIHLCCFCARRGIEMAWLASFSGSCVAAFYQNVWSSPVNPGLMPHTIFIPDFVDVCGLNRFFLNNLKTV